MSPIYSINMWASLVHCTTCLEISCFLGSGVKISADLKLILNLRHTDTTYQSKIIFAPEPEKQYSKNEITTISTFEVTTTFNDVPAIAKMVIKTNVVKVGGEWKIDDVTILSSQGTAN